jgi:hypothetical protein
MSETILKAIVNATILCPVNGLVKNGTVLFDNKIVAIGKDVEYRLGPRQLMLREVMLYRDSSMPIHIKDYSMEPLGGQEWTEMR